MRGFHWEAVTVGCGEPSGSHFFSLERTQSCLSSAAHVRDSSRLGAAQGGFGLVMGTHRRLSWSRKPPEAVGSPHPRLPRLIWSGMGAGTHGNSPPGGIYSLCGLGPGQSPEENRSLVGGNRNPRTGCSTDESLGDLAGTWRARYGFRGGLGLQPVTAARQ